MSLQLLRGQEAGTLLGTGGEGPGTGDPHPDHAHTRTHVDTRMHTPVLKLEQVSAHEDAARGIWRVSGCRAGVQGRACKHEILLRPAGTPDQLPQTSCPLRGCHRPRWCPGQTEAGGQVRSSWETGRQRGSGENRIPLPQGNGCDPEREMQSLGQGLRVGAAVTGAPTPPPRLGAVRLAPVVISAPVRGTSRHRRGCSEPGTRCDTGVPSPPSSLPLAPRARPPASATGATHSQALPCRLSRPCISRAQSVLLTLC